MKKKKLGFLYNTRVTLDPLDKKFASNADWDDPKTVYWMKEHLSQLGYEVIGIEADENAYEKLKKSRAQLELVFNYAEGKLGSNREAQMPTILELLDIPFTGSNSLALSIALNKALTKDLLKSYQVPVTQHWLVNGEILNKPNNLDYPLIVKPVAEGSSAGIANKGVVQNFMELQNQVKAVSFEFRQSVIVEPFLSGREYSVGLLGNPPELLPIVEPNHKVLPKEMYPIDSLEVKWIFEENHENYLICPAKINLKKMKKIKEIALTVWHSLNLQDYARMELREDEHGDIFFLEVNPLAGLMPPEVTNTSYLPLAAKTAGISYNELLSKIISSAKKRFRSKFSQK